MSKENHFRADGYMNMLTKAGTWKDSTEAYVYQYETPTPDVELAQMYQSNGLFTRIIDKPSEMALKNGFDFGIGDADIEQYLQKKLTKLKWTSNATKAEKWARLFGGSGILMCIDDDCDWDDPVDKDIARGINCLVVFERPEIQPDYNSVYMQLFDSSQVGKFARPEYYLVTPMYGGRQFRVHESRILIFRNGELPRTSTTSTEYMFFGAPEYNRIKRELRDTITSHGNGYRLLERCVQAVYKMSNLAAMLATEDGEDDVIRRMQLIDMARSLLNTMVIDADGEDYTFQTFQLTGVKDIIDEACNMLSAVTNIPQTVLFGRSPAGENATGESDLSNYYDYIGQIQNLDIVDNLHRLVDIILAAGKNRGEISEIPEHEITPKPLWNLDEKEQAELEQAKAQAELTKAQATQAYIDMQVLDPQEVRKALAESDVYHIEDVLSDDGEDDELQIQIPISESPLEEPASTSSDKESNIGIMLPDDTVKDSEENLVGIDLNDTSNSAIKIDLPDGKAESGSADTKTGVGVLVIKDGRILCGTRTDTGEICGPGGHIEVGESPEDAAVRETQEEFNITPLTLIPLGSYKGSSGLYCPSTMYFTVDFTGTPKADDDEMKGQRWLSLQELEKEKLFSPFAASIKNLLEVLTMHNDGDDEGKWITTKNGKHIQISKDGEVLKGNPTAMGQTNDKTPDQKPKKKLQPAVKNVNIASATGKNTLEVKGFKNKQHLNNHWKNGRNHQEEYKKDGIVTAEQYEERAVKLAEMPVGGNIKGYKTQENYICRYDVDKNDYVKADLKKGVRTMFKPEKGETYFRDMMAAEGVSEDE